MIVVIIKKGDNKKRLPLSDNLSNLVAEAKQISKHFLEDLERLNELTNKVALLKNISD